MSETLNVEIRDIRGKRRIRRLRRSGKIPAILYGHGEDVLSLSIAEPDLSAVVRHGSRVVDLTGAISQKAFIRELQWDTLGLNVLHLDLTRVSADERVQVEVSIELRGEAPGVREGGVIELQQHEIEVECAAISIPENIQVSISGLNKDQAITVADLNLPPGVTALTPPETVVVQCVEPAAELEEEGVPGAGAEPEVIGRRAEDEGEED